MNGKKFVGAWVVGAVVMFVLAGLWHMVILSGFYARHAYFPAREGALIGYIFLGYIVLALLMAYVYPKGYSDGSPAAQGLKFGVIIGILWVLPHGIVLYGVHHSGTRALILVDTIWHMVEQGVGGLVIGAIYGRIGEAEGEAA